MNNLQNEMTVGKFIETRLGKTYDEWLEMTPIEFFRAFWNKNLDKISPDKLSEFFDNLESDDSSDEFPNMKTNTIAKYTSDEENRAMWNCNLEIFIREMVDPDYEMKEFLQLVREKLPQESIPIRHELMYNGEAKGYFRLTESIPTDKYRWFWDKFHRMIFQIEDKIYFQRYTNNNGCIMMGEIKTNFSESCFNDELDDEEFKTISKKVQEFDSTTYHHNIDKQFYTGNNLESGIDYQPMIPQITTHDILLSSQPIRKEGSDENEASPNSCELL